MSVVLRTTQDIAGSVSARVAYTFNRVFPPKQRERALENLRAFSVHNPKLAAFLAAQIALAGLPILLFLAFAVSTLAVSLVTCILLGIITAFVFTLLVTGLTLLFVVPVVFIGSCTASIVFTWGLVGFLLLQRINGGETPVQPGTKIGDELNRLTGGRLRDLADRAGSHSQQERLSPGAKNVSVGQHQREEHNARGGPPRGRYHEETNGVGHSGKAGEEEQEGRTRSAQIGARDVSQRERAHPEAGLNTYSPTAERVVDWKTEFQREGITT